MATQTEPRLPLSRDRILRAALALADEGGIDALTMRKLGQALGFEAMSLYNHVANKNDVVEGLLDLVLGETEPPSTTEDWDTAIRTSAISVHQALRRHPWAIGLLESRANPGAATLRHHDATIATLRKAGFSVAMTAHAYALLDSYIYGFALQETSLPFNPETVTELAGPASQQISARDYPHLAEMATEHILQPGYDFGDEFEIGLSVILHALTTSIPGNRGRPSLTPSS